MFLIQKSIYTFILRMYKIKGTPKEKMLTTEQKRILLFLFGCMTVRIYITYIAYTCKEDTLSILGWLALLPAIGFSIIYAFNLRKTGPEVFGETIWWNNLRPIHALLYFGFAICAIQKKKWSYLFLLADVVLGFTAFIAKHFK